MSHDATSIASLPADEPSPRAYFERLSIALGVLLSFHLMLVVAVKIAEGVGAQAWWLSHVTLGLGAAALLLRSVRLASIAFACLLVPHALWLIDAACGMSSGFFPLRLTEYLTWSGPWQWSATSHHFYLAPLLAIMIPRLAARRGESTCVDWRAIAFPAALLMLTLTVVGRTLLPTHENVNFSHGAFVQADWVWSRWVSGRPAPLYLVLLNGANLLACIVPGALAASALAATAQRRVERHPSASSALFRAAPA